MITWQPAAHCESAAALSEEMMKKVLTLTMLVGAVALSACGSSPNQSVEPPREDPATTSTVLTPGAPQPQELTRVLGVPVEAAPGEVNQYLVRAPQGTVDFAKLGSVHTDVGYAVGVTLQNGTQIGFRFEPREDAAKAPAPDAESAAKPQN